MLAVTSYPKAYITGCKRQMEDQLRVYETLTTAVGKGKARGAVDGFEPLLFNNLILVLDHYFVHRMRGNEGKDGNPLNEVRMLCDGIMKHGAVLEANSTIKYKAENSVLGLEIGDKIDIDIVQFRELFSAFFAELSKKFG